jgi:DNA-binding PadR family transcriptional regulator
MREGWFGPPRGGRRARRGDVRTAVLALLAEEPAHGYDLIRTLEERSGGMWQPSPGSVYPTLQLLEDQGLLTSEEVDGKRIYSITDEGRAQLAERREQRGGGAPWEMWRGEGSETFGKLFAAMSQLGAAVMQVARGGDGTQVDRVVGIVNDARKKVYAILAED